MSIVFIDEGNAFIFSDEFSEAIQKTDNYYVIVSREGLPNLPYSGTEIYGIRMSGRYGGLKQCYNEFYRIYRRSLPEEKVTPDAVITEDSNAGYQFFNSVCKETGISCKAAGGKSKLLVEKTNGTYLQYSKSQLNPAYLMGTVREAILQQMDKIEIKKY